MDFEDGIDLINKAGEKSVEDKLFLRWLPYQMNVSFDDFKNELMSNLNAVVKGKDETKEEILANVKKIFGKKAGE